MFPKDFAQLSSSSTLADLPTHRFQIEASALGQSIQDEFLNRPELPGIFIVSGDEVAGVISRQKFLEQMSQPYGLELYLRRPASMLLGVIEADALCLPSTCRIGDAVRQALSRPLDLLYEPIVVRSEEEPNRLGLLEFNVLLLAQSQVFARVSERLKVEKEQARQYALGLQKEQMRVKEYAAKLQAEQAEVQRHNQILELQRAQLTKQTQEIGAYNERFIRIGRLLSIEGKRTFAEMLHSVNAIGDCTERIDSIGKAFSQELESVNSATESIERVSQQVRHLSIQAALIANRAQNEGGDSNPLAGFGNITSEIGSLGSKSFEATERVNQIANRFRFQIKELRDAAAESNAVARALLKRSQQTQEALQELERLTGGSDASLEPATEDTPIASAEMAAIG